MEFPLWASLAIVALSVVAVICLVACCVVRCFRPENTRGPAWVPTKEGHEQLAKSWYRHAGEDLVGADDDKRRWLRRSGLDGKQAAPQPQPQPQPQPSQPVATIPPLVVNA